MSRFDREKPIDIIWLHNGENSVCYQIYQAVYNKNKKYTLMLFARSNEYLNLKPPKQKSQISLVFGMNALVSLGTIKTL
ncbi:hypothetical protein FIM74_07370 [Helicobacter pylori]|nr:hypothetical protein FIM74_07370 [Helicobacter pylori]